MESKVSQMKLNRLSRIILSMLFTLFMLVPLSSLENVSAQDISFDITEADITGEISSNGDVSFKEIYTFDVDFMNGAYHNIDYGGYNITDYRVGILDKETGDIEYLTESFDESPGTYRVSDNGEIFKLQVFNPAEDETVHFVFEYTLVELITNYNDTAEINRKIVPENTDDNFSVDARIYLPGNVSNQEDFRAWGYGPYDAHIEPVMEGERSYVEITVPNNPPNQFVEVNAIFPTALTPNNTNIVQANMKDEIIERSNATVEADAEAHESSKQRRWLWVTLALIGFPLVTAFAWVYYFRNHRKLNPKPAQIPDHIYSLPEDLTPAIMATTVLRDKPIADDFSATIIDLARKGYIQVEEVSREKRGLLKRKSASTILVSPIEGGADLFDLQKHERYVYEYLLPNDEPITLSQIEENIENNRNFKKQKYRKWTQFANYVAVKGEQVKNQPSQYNTSVGYAVLAIIASVVMLFAVLFLTLDSPLEEHLVPILLAFALNLTLAIVILLFTLLRPIRTYEQDKMIKEWKGFANMLDDIGNFNMREVASLPLWEEFLVYAISLDVADKVIEAMNDEYGIEELSHMSMPMVLYSNPYWINQVVRPSISQSLTSSAPAQSSYSGSNTGGFGGGFSSGSSGGSGGGGGTGGF